jgi:hypothetical protein
MVELANMLFTESVNQSNPIMPADRTLPPDDFLAHYLAHSHALCNIIDQHPDPIQLPEVEDEELKAARRVLKERLAVLQEKLEKLNTLRFWMDNMLHGRPPPAQAQGGD